MKRSEPHPINPLVLADWNSTEQRSVSRCHSLKRLDLIFRVTQHSPQSHIFDGKTINKETAAFQLCDLHDPLLQELVEDDDDLRDQCHEKDGWYSSTNYERIKTVLRHKFFSLLDGYVASDEECRALLEMPAERKVAARPGPKYGKHNMAKGAQRPEDAAVSGRNRFTVRKQVELIVFRL